MTGTPVLEGGSRATAWRQLLGRLPGRLPWAVGFALPELVAAAGPVRVHAALGLAAEGAPLPGPAPEYVVLTSIGTRCFDAVGRPVATPGVGAAGPGEMVPGAGEVLAEPDEMGTDPGEGPARSLADRFATLLDRAHPETAACVGLGQRVGGEPVLMTVGFGDPGGPADRGAGEAWFATAPDREGWGLLAAVGVRPGGPAVPLGPDGPWYARFELRLVDHLEAAHVAGYARTANCNAFFLGQGRVDPPLAEGLQRAAAGRLRVAGQTAYRRGLEVGARATEAGGGALMTAVGPGGPRPYGDLVPLGLLLAGLRRLPEGSPALARRGLGVVAGLRRHLQERQVDGGWPFHTATITTGLDSVLVLLGLGDPGAVPALERFALPGGGYAADRSGAPGPSTVAEDPTTAHWHGPDLATTCLVRMLRRRSGRSETVPWSWIGERVGGRGSLFIANPWLLDWVIGLGLEGDPAPGAAALRQRLRREVWASRNEDGTFGRSDERVLSSAAAALALQVLGADAHRLARAQLALARTADQEHPVAVPFASTRRIVGDGAQARAVRSLLQGQGVVAAAGQLHAVTIYQDTAGAIAAGLVALALSHPAELGATGEPGVVGDDPDDPGVPDTRYRCGSVEAYVARYALPPALQLPVT